MHDKSERHFVNKSASEHVDIVKMFHAGGRVKLIRSL